MKKRLFITISVVVAAIVVVVVSCKKDDQNALLDNNNETPRSITQRHIDDMNAYLTDFRKKMLESKSDEVLGLEDAAWHLASLANFEHCNINVHFDDVRFDTIYMQVNVTGGSVLMSDLRTAYEQMWPEIQKFQKGLNLNNQNLRFVNMTISDSGKASIFMMTTFFSEEKVSHLWYFPDMNYLDSVCQLYYDEYASYSWNYGAVRKLNTVINALEGNLYIPSQPQSSAYSPTRSYTFYYNLWIDPYDYPPFYNYSRLFAMNWTSHDLCYLDAYMMCYCTDSYIGLGYYYLETYPNPEYEDERPVYWMVTSETIPNSSIICHKLTVQYGYPIAIGPNPGDN